MEKFYGKELYLINGFYASGKTKFVKHIVEQALIKMEGTTLLILCEQGENEYEAEFLTKNHIKIELIKNEKDFTIAALQTLDEIYHPNQVIIEYNGMWNHKELELPNCWMIEQQMTTIDTRTFAWDYTNRKEWMEDMVENSEMIVLNRGEDIEHLGEYKERIRMMNGFASVILEGHDFKKLTV